MPECLDMFFYWSGVAFWTAAFIGMVVGFTICFFALWRQAFEWSLVRRLFFDDKFRRGFTKSARRCEMNGELFVTALYNVLRLYKSDMRVVKRAKSLERR